MKLGETIDGCWATYEEAILASAQLVRIELISRVCDESVPIFCTQWIAFVLIVFLVNPYSGDDSEAELRKSCWPPRDHELYTLCRTNLKSVHCSYSPEVLIATSEMISNCLCG